MIATVHVEFDLNEGQPEDTAHTALNGGVGALKLAIERGVTGAAETGVREGSVQAHIVEKTITRSPGGPPARAVARAS